MIKTDFPSQGFTASWKVMRKRQKYLRVTKTSSNWCNRNAQGFHGNTRKKKKNLIFPGNRAGENSQARLCFVLVWGFFCFLLWWSFLGEFLVFCWKKFICKETWRGIFRKKSLQGSVEGKLHSVLGKWKYRRMRSEDEGACRSCLLLLQTTDELNRACHINKALLAPSPVLHSPHHLWL